MRHSTLRLAIAIFCGTLLFGACNFQSLSGPDDKTIVAEVQSKLFQDPVLKIRDIRVVSEKGVVVLSGAVNSDSEKAAAERAANEARGVKQVINQLTVSAPTAQGAEPSAPTESARTQPAARATAGPRAASHRAETAQPTAAAESSRPSSADSTSTPQPPPVPPRPVTITIPSGTVITVRMIDSIDSSRNRPGEDFAASVNNPVVVDGQVIIPQGADARVRLVEARTSGHMTGRSELQLQLVGIAIGGQTYSVESTTYQQVGTSRGTQTAEKVGGGAAIGAIIGAIAGGRKGAAIGAGVGAGAGTGVQAASHAQVLKVPSESKIDFTVKNPITVTR